MARVQGFFLTAPIFSKSGIPAQIKIGLSAIFCFTLYDTIFAKSSSLIPVTDVGLSAVIFLELLIGAVLGFLVNLIFDVITTYAQMIGIQIGQSSGEVFNPASDSSANPVATFYGDLAILFFIVSGGLFHTVLLLKRSFEILPLATFTFDYSVLAENFIKVFNNIFVLGLKMLLPMIALMFIIDIFIAMFSKILPQVSMFFLLTPMKIFILLLVSMFIINGLYMNISDYFTEGIYGYLDQLFWAEN